MKVTHHYSDMLYKSEYVEFGLELVDEDYFIHVEVLILDEHTRDQVLKTWIGLQQYLLCEGINEVSALIHKDNMSLKKFSSSYGFTKEFEVDDSEIWIKELS